MSLLLPSSHTHIAPSCQPSKGGEGSPAPNPRVPFPSSGSLFHPHGPLSIPRFSSPSPRSSLHPQGLFFIPRVLSPSPGSSLHPHIPFPSPGSLFHSQRPLCIPRVTSPSPGSLFHPQSPLFIPRVPSPSPGFSLHPSHTSCTSRTPAAPPLYKEIPEGGQGAEISPLEANHQMPPSMTGKCWGCPPAGVWSTSSTQNGAEQTRATNNSQFGDKLRGFSSTGVWVWCFWHSQKDSSALACWSASICCKRNSESFTSKNHIIPQNFDKQTQHSFKWGLFAVITTSFHKTHY